MIEFSKETETSEEKILTGALELCIDREHISIPVSRFEALVHAEAELNIVSRVYQNCESYRLGEALRAVFGTRDADKPGEGGGDA